MPATDLGNFAIIHFTGLQQRSSEAFGLSRGHHLPGAVSAANTWESCEGTSHLSAPLMCLSARHPAASHFALREKSRQTKERMDSNCDGRSGRKGRLAELADISTGSPAMEGGNVLTMSLLSRCTICMLEYVSGSAPSYAIVFFCNVLVINP